MPTRFTWALALRTANGEVTRDQAGLHSGPLRPVPQHSEILRRLPADDRSEVEAWLVTPGARRELILVCGEAWLANN